MRNSDDDKQGQVVVVISALRSISIYKIILFFSLFHITDHTHAQLSEIGFQLGAYNYTGDLNQNYVIRNHRPAGAVFFRSNISSSIALRYGLGGGIISGNDRFANDPFNRVRNESFNIYLFEGFTLLEFYFLDYKSKHSRVHWTPYLNAGISLISFFGERPGQDNKNPLTPAFPLGIGIKYQLSRKFDISIETSARPTLTDHMDGIAGVDDRFKDYDYGNKYNFDTYYFVGFTINYTIYFIPCPYGFY